jgi:cytochrome P450 family 4
MSEFKNLNRKEDNLHLNFRLSNLIDCRIRNPLLYIDYIYNFSRTKKLFDKNVKVLNDFTDKIILSRREKLMKNTESEIFIDSDEDDIGAKKKVTFLDILLRSSIDGKPLSNKEIQDEVKTFTIVGHDTLANSISFCLYLLAKHPEVQNKVFQEIRNVMGDDPMKSATFSDLNVLKYLEMVIKESLRFFPVIPFLARKFDENVEIGK